MIRLEQVDTQGPQLHFDGGADADADAVDERHGAFDVLCRVRCREEAKVIVTSNRLSKIC